MKPLSHCYRARRPRLAIAARGVVALPLGVASLATLAVRPASAGEGSGISINGAQLPTFRSPASSSSFAGGAAGSASGGEVIDRDAAASHGAPPVTPPPDKAAGPPPSPEAGKGAGVSSPAPAPPPGWSDAEIKAAQEQCRRKLAGLGAEYTFLPQVKSGPCGTPAPIELSGFGKHLAISPPITVTCEIAAALHGWLKANVQPLAKRHLGTSIVQINTMSSYACRNRYGARNAPLSQHAFANAIDVRGFVTAKGQLLDVEQHWGPTAKELVAFRATQSQPVASASAPIVTGSVPNSAPLGAASAPSRVAGDWATTLATGPAIMPAAVGTASGVKGHEAQLPAAPSATPAASAAVAALRSTFPVVSKVAHLSTIGPIKMVATGQIADAGPPGVQPGQALDGRAIFFREAWQSACGPFTTVLGPEANRAHRNHLHLDLAQRKTGAFCQ